MNAKNLNSNKNSSNKNSNIKNSNIEYTNKAKRSKKANRRLARTLIGTSLLIVIGAGFTAVSQASNDAVNQGTNGFTQITVGSGQTLWSLASAIDSRKAADLVSQIEEINHLSQPQIVAGEKIWIPLHS